MALATRRKPNAHDRKRQAGHHVHGKSYLDTYWPYIPMLAVVGGGALLNSALYRTTTVTASAGAVISGSGGSSRIQDLLGNQASWIFLAVLAITGVTFTVFIVSHWYRIHRFINKGEAYIISRPLLEISAVFIFTVGFVLTRSAGLPH